MRKNRVSEDTSALANSDSASQILGENGPFITHVEGFAPRSEQQEMAAAIEAVLANNSTLVAEAGTGTGKTFAYLVPAILSGGRVVISTGTKNLQDQLFQKDIPIVKKVLNVPVDVALLKGRANYLCLHRMNLTMQEGRFTSRHQASDMQEIRGWSGRTLSGDIAECDPVAENSPLWSRVTSTADNCLGGECDHYNECFLTKARRKAQECEILVINHHLFFADMALRESGVTELIPDANSFIFDEAHQLADVASSFFGLSVSANQLLELARDTVAENIKEAGGERRLSLCADKLEKAVRDLRLALGEAQTRASWAVIANDVTVQKGITDVVSELKSLHEQLEIQAERGKGLASCFSRVCGFIEQFKIVTTHPPAEHIHWFETFKHSFSFNITPLDIAALFQQQLEAMPPGGWIFTSATLAVKENFDHFSHQLGLTKTAQTRRWQSPFDFNRQALLYVPENMPEPSSSSYTHAVIEAAIPVIKACGGGAFILFTSHRALRIGAELLEDRLEYPLLVQGDEPRSRLLERFRELGNAVLLGTGSFWEGVDVRGKALSCVVIDKLPFASPGDPIMQARIDSMREKGLNPFMQFQLPQAVLSLKQGVGRLIRDVNDYGVLMLCDPRLGTKGYGRTFIESLPQMSKTRQLEVVERFYKHHKIKENS
jgi:ATP-dependent DNA helicase DinG